MQIDIIGVPIDLGADRRGVDMRNIELPIAEMYAETDPKLNYVDCIVPMAKRAAGAVATSVQAGHYPLVLGGDHSLSLGSVRGAARAKQLGVIWIDAHADFNTEETTPSGKIYGTLVAVYGLGDAHLTRLWDDPLPVVDPGHVAVIGLRDLDSPWNSCFQRREKGSEPAI